MEIRRKYANEKKVNPNIIYEGIMRGLYLFKLHQILNSEGVTLTVYI